MNKELKEIMDNFCTDRTDNYYTSSMEDAWSDFAVNEDRPKVPRVQKGYKVSTLSHKQNKPIKTVETRDVDKT